MDLLFLLMAGRLLSRISPGTSSLAKPRSRDNTDSLSRTRPRSATSRLGKGQFRHFPPS